MSPWVYGAVFLLTGAAAYYWDSLATQTEKPAASTIIVHIREQPAEQQAAQAGTPVLQARPELEVVRKRALAALGERGSEGLIFEAIPSSAGDCQIAVTATRAAPQRASETAGLAARAYADAYRNEWKSLAARENRAVQEAAARAERELRDAQSKLQTFYEQQLQAAQEVVRRQALAQAARPAPPSPPAAGPPAAENPEWADLSRQLGALRQRRGDLLVHRTPLHPDVLDIEARIQQVEQQMASVPRTLAGPMLAPAAAPPPAVREQPTQEPPPVVQMDSAELQRFKEGVQRAERATADAIRAERFAWQHGQQEPTIDLEETPAQAAAQAPRSTLSKLMAALAAGLSTVAGLGLITSGVAIEPVLATVGEVHSAIGLPVVGVVPESSPGVRKSKDSRRQRWLRIGLVSGGVGLLAACLVIMVAMHTG
jgi:hypothetical protein